MGKQTVLQVRIDSDLKAEAENIYKNLGTSLTEAVRIFISQSTKENGFPFLPTNNTSETTARGALKEYANPALREEEDSAFLKAMIEKHA